MTSTRQFPKTLCILLGLVGLAAYVFVGWVDYIYGEATAFSAEGKASQPIIMIIVSVAGFCFISAAGAAARVRYYLAAFLMLVLSIGCMAYSGLNGIGFFAGETMSLTRQAEAKNKAAQDATNKANEESIRLRRDAMTWMTGTQIKTTKERERVEDKVIDLATRPVEIKTADVQASVVDARSVAMKKIFGMEVENAQLTNSVWLVTILLGCKLLGPSLAFALWPASNFDGQRQNEKRSVPKENAGFQGSSVKMVSIDDALQDLRLIYPKTAHPITVSFLRDRWGIKRQTVHYRLGVWEQQKIIATKKTSEGEVYVSSVSPLRVVASNPNAKSA